VPDFINITLINLINRKNPSITVCIWWIVNYRSQINALNDILSFKSHRLCHLLRKYPSMLWNYCNNGRAVDGAKRIGGHWTTTLSCIPTTAVACKQCCCYSDCTSEHTNTLEYLRGSLETCVWQGMNSNVSVCNMSSVAFPLTKQTLERLKTVRPYPLALGGGSGWSWRRVGERLSDAWLIFVVRK